MSLVEVSGDERLEVAKMMSVRIMRNLEDKELNRAIANYSSLDLEGKGYIRKLEYWPMLDEAIDMGVQGQI